MLVTPAVSSQGMVRDHKPELEAERERIQSAGSFILMGHVNGNLNLSRAIGDMKFKQNKFLPPDKQILTANPDINIVELCDDDEFIVLACDGIWDCMSSQQLVDFIREHIDTKLNELSPFVWLGMLLFAFLIDTCSDGGLAFLLDT
ncbi:putative protein phosphatase 2C 21 [Zea mays]|uniref:protein-serine/threonine phosphatase n=2 Tax=Zea mays TaxID=4577 RepID=A0A1D6P7P8_MAIZE|nr:putative protein phosphatase 2C 21 [Zea mays]